MTIYTFVASKNFAIVYPQSKTVVMCQRGACMVNPCGVVVNVKAGELKAITAKLVSFEGYAVKNDNDFSYAELSALK